MRLTFTVLALALAVAVALPADEESRKPDRYPEKRTGNMGYRQFETSTGTRMRQFDILTVGAGYHPREGFGGTASLRLHAIDFRGKYRLATGLAGVLDGWYRQPIIQRSAIGSWHVRPGSTLDLGYALNEKERFDSPEMRVWDLTWRPFLMAGVASNPGSHYWELEAGPYIDLPMYRHVRYSRPRPFAADVTVEEHLRPITHFGLQASGYLSIDSRQQLIFEAHVRLYNEYSLHAGVTWRFD